MASVNMYYGHCDVCEEGFESDRFVDMTTFGTYIQCPGCGKRFPAPTTKSKRQQSTELSKGVLEERAFKSRMDEIAEEAYHRAQSVKRAVESGKRRAWQESAAMSCGMMPAWAQPPQRAKPARLKRPDGRPSEGQLSVLAAAAGLYSRHDYETTLALEDYHKERERKARIAEEYENELSVWNAKKD